MGQFNKVPFLASDNAHTVPQRALDCGQGLGGLNQVCSTYFSFLRHYEILHLHIYTC